MDLQALRRQIADYVPRGEQEMTEKELMLKYIDRFPDILTRGNRMAHITASAWIVNPQRTKVVMVYHNIYKSWSWVGGHADGDADQLSVALREAQEETGLVCRAVDNAIFSLEILSVAAHYRRGEFVPTHLHLNVTYLLEAEENALLRVRPEENSGVAWVPCEEALAKSTEPEMQVVYQKLLDRMR